MFIVYLNISTYLHVTQHVIYTCQPYGCEVHWYVHNTLLVVAISNDMYLGTYLMSTICHILILIKKSKIKSVKV